MSLLWYVSSASVRYHALIRVSMIVFWLSDDMVASHPLKYYSVCSFLRVILIVPIFPGVAVIKVNVYTLACCLVSNKPFGWDATCKFRILLF